MLGGSGACVAWGRGAGRVVLVASHFLCRVQRRYLSTQNFAYALTSYFCLPEQGMRDYELLSRASLTVVPTSNRWKGSEKFHFLGPAHVTHPWRYKRFYPEESFGWLQFLEEEAVVNKIALKQKGSGDTLLEFPFKAKSYLHPSLDLVLLHLEEETAVVRELEQHGLRIDHVQLNSSSLEIEGKEVEIFGHELVRDLKNPDEEKMLPISTRGVVNMVLPRALCVQTPTPVPMGVCGGPVLLRTSQNRCVGLVEALIGKTNDPLLKKVENNALVIRSSLIAEFIEQVETNQLGSTDGGFLENRQKINGKDGRSVNKQRSPSVTDEEDQIFG